MDRKESYFEPEAMTFPLELAQIHEDGQKDINYLIPMELAEIQDMVSQVCDQMEYSGSVMYDECPDKVTVEGMAKAICRENRHRCRNADDERWLQMMIEVMLCHEMSCRRWRR